MRSKKYLYGGPVRVKSILDNPKDNEVTIEHKAIGLNYIDTIIIWTLPSKLTYIYWS